MYGPNNLLISKAPVLLGADVPLPLAHELPISSAAFFKRSAALNILSDILQNIGTLQNVSDYMHICMMHIESFFTKPKKVGQPHKKPEFNSKVEKEVNVRQTPK